MNEKLDKQLCADFPKLFSDRNASITQSLMPFGFECGDGWEPLIRECAEKLEAINDKIKQPEYWIRASQVKEKYGTLRLYTTSYPYDYADEIERAVEMAELKSETTCEVCGEPGETKGSGWLRTVCVKHERS